MDYNYSDSNRNVQPESAEGGRRQSQNHSYSNFNNTPTNTPRNRSLNLTNNSHILQQTTIGTGTTSNQFIKKSLDILLDKKRSRQSLKWGIINIIILLILLYDISCQCSYVISYWNYLEYCIAGVFSISVLYNFGRYFCYRLNFEPMIGTEAQRKLLNFSKNDGSFVTTINTSIKKPANGANFNLSSLSWHSSFNDSQNRSVGLSGFWNYNRQHHQPTAVSSSSTSRFSPNTSFNQTTLSQNLSIGPFVSPYKRYPNDEMIMDECRLQQYLRETAQQEKHLASISDVYDVTDRNSMNSLWNYCNNAVNLLKTSLYQIAPTNTASPNKSTSGDGGGGSGDITGECKGICGRIVGTGGISNSSTIGNGYYANVSNVSITAGGNVIDEVSGIFNDFHGNSEILQKISSAQLSKYVTNLRIWLSTTILQRLICEIQKIDTSFKSRGFSDMQIGGVGLERLKKTAENQQIVMMNAPMLPIVVPFLEMSTNQEYLVQRIKELGKSTCLADYRWNSGSSYHGLNWDEHLPTDSAILFHLFCAYMDSQSMPLPQPGGRPFFNRYVVVASGDNKKSIKETLNEVQNKSKCAILFTNSIKPKFNFISDEKIHNCIHDRNNLFYVIIQFLLYMKNHHEGLLEGVNLGKSGINILCVIED